MTSLLEILNTPVVSASKSLEKASEAPATLIVLRREDLERRGYTELTQLFDDLPGMSLARAYGDTQMKSYWRGFRNVHGDPFLILVDGITAVPPDPYALEDLAVRGDSLHATVRFGGGCRTHEFRLLILKTFRESEPVQGDAVISHRANGDPCRALLTRTLAFDLAPIREHYRQSYQREHGAIRLRLLPPGEGTGEYRF